MKTAAWRVWFDRETALIVQAEDEREARLEARFAAWLATGKWLEVERVEAI